MKKLIVAMALLGSCGTVCAATLSERAGKWDVGVGASGVFYKDELQDDSVYVSGSFNYGVIEYVSVGVELGYYFDSQTNGAPGDYDVLGDANGFAAMLNSRIYLPVQESLIQPYLMAGIGGIFWDFDTHQELVDDGFDLGLEPALAIQVGGGADWFITDRIALNVEAAYVFSSPDSTVEYESVVYTGEEAGGGNHVKVTGGIKALL